MMKYIYILIILFVISINQPLNSQNRIHVSNKTPILMDFTPSYNAGVAKKVIVDDSQWLNYTTLIHPSDPTYSITIEIAGGMVPEGMELQVEASPYVGMSKSKQGTSNGKIILSNRPKVLINDIATCYSGSGKYEGHQLTFSFVVKDYAKLKSGTTNLYIQYTLTQ